MSRFETYAFLPPLANGQIEAQLNWLITSSWVAGIEFAEGPTSADFFWRQWPLQPARYDSYGKPQALTATNILTQLDACQRRHPYAHIRLTGYNPTTGMQEMAFICRTPQEGQ